jgi:hypothetical protein
MRTKDFYFKERPLWGDVGMFGTRAQMKRSEPILIMCYHTFTRITGIKLGDGAPKRVRMTFEEIEE